MAKPLAIQAHLELGWDDWISTKNSTRHWTLPKDARVPVRRKPVSSRTERDRPVDIAWSEDRSSWVIDDRYSGKGLRKLILIEDAVELVLARWTKDRDVITRVEFVRNMLNEYGGIAHNDLGYLITRINLLLPSKSRGICRGNPVHSAVSTNTRVGSHQPSDDEKMEDDDSDMENDGSIMRSIEPTLSLSRGTLADEQVRLFDDPRRHALQQEFYNLRDIKDEPLARSHFRRTLDVALNVFEHGRPARPALFTDDLEIQQAADYIVMTEAQHSIWMREVPLLKPVVIRDQAGFALRRTAIDRATYFAKMRLYPADSSVNIQDLRRPHYESTATRALVSSTLDRYERCKGNHINGEDPPLNLLDLADNTRGVWLEGLAKYCQLLDDASAAVHRQSISRVALLDQGTGQTIGKLSAWSPNDLGSSAQFRLFGARGAVSGWHLDLIGPWTWVTIEGDDSSRSQKADEVVKYWPFYPRNGPIEEQRMDMEEFARQGGDWNPKPTIGLPILSLIQGDTLVMPPGLIHAPITLTDCLIVGGMCWHKRHIYATVRAWHWAMKHPNCTNEDLPKQTRAIIAFLLSHVNRSPAEFGVEEGQLPKFTQYCNHIMAAAPSCICLEEDCKCGLDG